MNKTITRLEQALVFWEDQAFCASVNYRLRIPDFQVPESGLRGTLVNFGKLRRSMLDVFSIEEEELSKRFSFPREANQILNNHLMTVFPLSLLAWAKSSRRVYSMTRDLQALLDATSLEGVVWKDIKLPFDSFVLTLEQPLIDANGHKFDCAFVTRLKSVGEITSFLLLTIMLFDSLFGEYRCLSQSLKSEIEQSVEKG